MQDVIEKTEELNNNTEEGKGKLHLFLSKDLVAHYNNGVPLVAACGAVQTKGVREERMSAEEVANSKLPICQPCFLIGLEKHI